MLPKHIDTELRVNQASSTPVRCGQKRRKWAEERRGEWRTEGGQERGKVDRGGSEGEGGEKAGAEEE